MPKYRVIKEYVCQEEWLVEADDKQQAMNCVWNPYNMTPTPDIRSNIKNHWVKVKEDEDADRSKD
tara:strand:+ start:376 stop:570 length:195 start_codon:yes stop_codon:yes gene_type:complete